MSIHLNAQQNNDWHEAIDAVEETAANTDTQSGSKAHLTHMAEYVRDDPRGVIRLLAIVRTT